MVLLRSKVRVKVAAIYRDVIRSDIVRRKSTSHYTRTDRAANSLHGIGITLHFLPYADGSCLIKCGNTEVVCTVSVDESTPPFLRDKEQGQVTAEYGMLPASTAACTRREAATDKQSGRTQEVQRLAGHSLHAVVDMEKLGRRQILIDCDVVQTDGGTRTAPITGVFIALQITAEELLSDGLIGENPIHEAVATVSAGMAGDVPFLDLDYPGDSGCDSDINTVVTVSGKIIETQDTVEGASSSLDELGKLIALAQKGIARLVRRQQNALQISRLVR